MKFLSILVAVGLCITPSTQIPAVECGEGLVVMSGNSICIEPAYIEGCQAYLSENECG